MTGGIIKGGIIKGGIMKGRIKQFFIAAAVLFGLSLVVGATINLPASAQGLVTGRNTILIDQLVERSGAQELVQAVVEAGVVGIEPRPDRNSARRRGNQAAENRPNRNRRVGNQPGANQQGRGPANFRLTGNLADQIERLEPEVVYQIAVDAGLISQAEATRLLEQ